MFTDAPKDKDAQKLLAEKFNEWWNANYGANNTPTNVYSISDLGTGLKTIYYYEDVEGTLVKTDEYVNVEVDKNGKISVVDKEVTKTEELNEDLEIVEEDNTKQNSSEEKEETVKEETKIEDGNDNQIETKNVVINDDDYIVITGKDGSITIGYKYILGSKGYEKILKSLNLPEGTKVNTPVLLPTKPEEGISQKNSLKTGNLTISTDDGVNYVISGTGAKNVKVSSDSTKQLEEAADKSENGHLEGDEGKPNHEEPDEPTPDKPTPDKPTPDKPTPDKPTPKDPTPKNPTPKNPTKPSVPSILPKTGDDFNKGLFNLMSLSGITMLGIGALLNKKTKLARSGANCALIGMNSEYKNALAAKMMVNNGLSFSGRAI